MKILVISANYPPDHLGGYGLRIKDIVDGLRQKGYVLKVLTTIQTRNLYQLDLNQDYSVIRKLHDRRKAKFFPKEVIFDILDTKLIVNEIDDFQPDLIYLGHIYTLSKAIMPYLSRLDFPLVLDEGGASLKGAWMEHGRWFRFVGEYGNKIFLIRKLKPLLINLVCKLSNGRISKDWSWPLNLKVIINSYANLEQVKNLDVPIKKARVIYSGINLEKFTFSPREKINQPITILCPGRIEARKGLMDGIELIKYLSDKGTKANLFFVGAIASEEYHHELISRIKMLGVAEQVKINDMLPQSELIKLYHQADFCFFPSYQEMGLSRTPLEAMACGCLVISYGNEGSDEVIHHGQNGFLVQPGDLQNAADFIKMLLDSPNIYEKIVRNARQEIEDSYSLEKYVDRVEEIVKNIGIF